VLTLQLKRNKYQLKTTCVQKETKINTNQHIGSLRRGARWSSGQCARRAIAEAKHRSQWPVLGWVTKIYYLELLRASEGTLSRWCRLHLQSLAPAVGCICSR
jgi:hypothetical protein